MDEAVHIDCATEATGIQDFERLDVLDAIRIFSILCLSTAHNQKVSHELQVGFFHIRVEGRSNLVNEQQFLHERVGNDLLRILLRQSNDVLILAP